MNLHCGGRKIKSESDKRPYRIGSGNSNEKYPLNQLVSKGFLEEVIFEQRPVLKFITETSTKIEMGKACVRNSHALCQLQKYYRENSMVSTELCGCNCPSP